MTDLSHVWGSDLQIGPTGGLALASGSTEGQQRVIRRLMTNRGDYLWQLAYGAGLPARVGEPANATRIRATVRRQIFAEACVARTPAPVINVSVGTDNVVFLSISYTDADTGQTVPLTVPISPQPVIVGS